jgi:hypothetical protein
MLVKRRGNVVIIGKKSAEFIAQDRFRTLHLNWQKSNFYFGSDAGFRRNINKI